MKKLIAMIAALLLTSSMLSCSSQSSATTQEQSSSMVTESAAETSKPTGGKPMGGGMGGSSMDTSSIINQFTDVAYGSQSETQTLDIYLPNEESSSPYPVLVAIHGGAFMMGDSKGGDVAPVLEGVNRGYAVISINYRLSGEKVFPAAVNDVKASIRWIKANADR